MQANSQWSTVFVCVCVHSFRELNVSGTLVFDPQVELIRLNCTSLEVFSIGTVTKHLQVYDCRSMKHPVLLCRCRYYALAVSG
jgi:hypothetical protein